MKVGIIGGGIMGTCLGYFLSQKGVQVDIFEASPNAGGLVSSMILDDGTPVDRFYHTILSSDSHLRNLCEELGIADKLRFRETKSGFLYKGKIHSMNTIIDFLRFPPLRFIDRFRLGITIVNAQLIRNWRLLEGISIEKWLLKTGGKRAYENIWKPLLRAKFDGNFNDTPATFIWSRLVRMKSTHKGLDQKEEAGYLIGGHETVVRVLVDLIRAAGGKIFLKTPITEIVIEKNSMKGLLVDGEILAYDKVISTVALPIFSHLIPKAPNEFREILNQTHYLGVICPLMVLDQPLTGYWTINLADEGYPFTGIIETTSYIDPQHVGGHHLVYLPKYTAPENPLQKMADDEIKGFWLKNLKLIFPNFNLASIRQFIVQRARYVEPLHPMNSTDLIPAVQTPIENLFLASNSQIYPTLTNSESISRKAREIAEMITA